MKDVNLETWFGEMVYIVGPSGSGKTTLLSVLSGVLKPDAGTVIGGRNRYLASEQRSDSPISG